MWITSDVNLPVELVQAHASGNLVLFVGAGASVGAPSSLPSFTELARQLAAAAHVPFDEDMALDRFLGSMPPDFETHAQTLRIITHPDSRFNPTHSALVQLASAHGEPRIVTTNFDNHLITAATSARLPGCDVWIGPALPLGDTFSGVVHLHGSVLRPPAQLVLTDRDFGRAYLTEAWATRFLQRMFDEFTVLFVGYSHDDPIMRYLALGLPSRTHRYVLTHLPDDDKWRRLGITPVPYPAFERDHSALLLALKAWNRRARMGRLDHRAMMKEIIDAGPPLNPVDDDYVRQRLLTTDGAREFVQFASGVDWLRWIEGVEVFQRLFVGGSDAEESSVLCNWFGQIYVADSELNGAALGVAQRLGQRFSPALYQSLTWAAETLAASSLEDSRRWKAILATSIDGISAPPDLGMLLPFESADRVEESTLLRAALRPFLTLKPRWSFAQEDAMAPPWVEVSWHSSGEVLAKHVHNLVEDRSVGDPSLGSLLEDALGSAYDLLTSYGGESGFYDSLSARRSAIEPHPQDESRDPADALIDGLRDYGAKALSENPSLPDRWWSCGFTLFRRLALHLIELSPALGPDEKLRWVLDREVLFDSSVKHEVFRVLATATQDASPSERSRLLVAVLQGAEIPDEIPDAERHRAYSVYNLLVWLVRSRPLWAEAQRELDRIQNENPTFGPREFPDLNRWTSGSVWGEVLPIEVEDFVQDLDSDPNSALTKLMNVDYSEQRIDGPTWRSALTLVHDAVARRPDLGVRLWRSIGERSDLESKKSELREAILDGWKQGDLGELMPEVVSIVAGIVGDSSHTYTVTQLLVFQLDKNIDSPESSWVAEMRDIARAIWNLNRGKVENSSDSNPSTLALNSWPGRLAEYWILEVRRRWREKGELWSGLDEGERGAFEALLDGPEPEMQAIRPALGTHVMFLFEADPDFAQQHILPLFDGAFASQAWDAYLYGPRYDDRMLSAGFLQSIVDEWGRLGDLGSRGLREQFYGLVASVVIRGDITQLERQKLLDQSILASDGEHATAFATMIVRFFAQSAVGGADSWALWAQDHVTARLQGLPRNARPDELERWADLAPLVGEHAGEAFALLSGHGIGLGDRYRVPEWPAELLAANGPELVRYLAERIRNSTPAGWAAPLAVRRIISSLTTSLGESVCVPLTEAAEAAGFPTMEGTSG